MQKRIFSLILLVTMLIAILPFSALPASAETDGSLIYTVEDGKATIVGCDKSIAGNLEIPSFLGGYPVVEISVSAFQNCTGLTAVRIPNSVIYIGDWVFQNCVNLASIDLPDSLQVLGTEVFKNTAFYNDPDNWIDGVLYLGQYLIRIDLSYSGELVVREGTTHIADFACDFSEMGESGVTKVSLPESLRIIGCYAFWFCGMSEIHLPSALEKIGDGALMNCANLEEVYIPASVKTIGELNFQWCPSIISITVDKNNPVFSSFNGGLYNKNQTVLIKCPEAEENLIIADGVVSLESKAFRGCRALCSVVIPKSVKRISKDIFPHSTALEMIYYMGNDNDYNRIEIHEINEILLGAEWCNLFADVSTIHWAFGSVFYCNQNGIMVGTAENIFSPSVAMTRAALVSVLYRLEGSPAVSGNAGFSDVSSSAWYADAVAWASKAGIISGKGDGCFAPIDPVTRMSFVSILYRYAEYRGDDVAARADLSGFADSESIPAWARANIEWAVAEGLLNGSTGNNAVYVDPTGQATRAQGAVLLQKFCEM